MIKIWKFAEAPQHIRDLHPGGTEDTWVLQTPAALCAEVESILAEGPSPGPVSRYDLPDGLVVFFGFLSVAKRRASTA